MLPGSHDRRAGGDLTLQVVDLRVAQLEREALQRLHFAGADIDEVAVLRGHFVALGQHGLDLGADFAGAPVQLTVVGAHFEPSCLTERSPKPGR